MSQNAVSVVLRIFFFLLFCFGVVLGRGVNINAYDNLRRLSCMSKQ